MSITLKNEHATVTILEKGAELASFTIDGQEHVWDANPKYWNRHAPILFPIVGKLKDDFYLYEGKKYTQTQHGFARDEDFSVIEKSDTKVIFEQKSTPESLEKYPFHFVLRLTYTLDGTTLHLNYEVENPADNTLYFSLGAHPGFKLPLSDTLKKEDFQLSFSPKKERQLIPVESKEVLLQLDKKSSVPTDVLPLSTDLFKDGVLIYETPGATEILLETKDNRPFVKVSYEDMPYLGLWSMYPLDSPFVCIEPWWGLADREDTNHELTEKTGIQALNGHQTFNCHFSITSYLL